AHQPRGGARLPSANGWDGSFGLVPLTPSIRISCLPAPDVNRGPGDPPMVRRDDAPRDLLFGLLALQNGMVNRDQLVAAFGAWPGSSGRHLADLLAEPGALRPEHRPLLDALVDAHLKLHGGDPERSLAALEVHRSTREGLARAGGPQVEAT